ncbi:MAG: GT2 family glycosyltransferase [Paracoccaceae bacterium]|jgi:GT2 family glycosyltransferase
MTDLDAAAPALARRIGLVAIGRNEGARLRACLTRAAALAEAGAIGPQVYVDSGSTDDSVATAQALGAHVVHLDVSGGFTAGKARNAGAAALRAMSDPELIQFVDGDADLVEGWLDIAVAALDADPQLGAVAGRRREKFPGATIFNQLCDMEWNTPVGEAAAIGGDALYRAAAFHEVGGFDPHFICGEEPELNFRMRAKGWRIRRLDADMTLHDADMIRWSQWWKRTERTGWAFAEGAATYGATAEGYNKREARRIRLWGVLAPAAVLACLIAGLAIPAIRAPALTLAALGALVWPLMALRIARRRARDFGDPMAHGLLYGALVMLGKPAEAVGARRYARARARGDRGRIIEYKGPGAPAA